MAAVRSFTTSSEAIYMGGSDAGYGFVVKVVAVTAFMSTSMIGLNFALDPVSQFGPHGIEPIVPDYRLEKVAQYDSARSPPSGLILGTSRVATLPASTVGENGFNFAIVGGSVEDALATLLYAARRGEVKQVVVGVDYDRLSSDFPTHRDERARTPLGAELGEAPDGWATAKSAVDAFNPHLVPNNARAIYYNIVGFPPPVSTFDEDGTEHFPAIEIALSQGAYDYTRELDENSVARAAFDVAQGRFAMLPPPASDKASLIREIVTTSLREGATVTIVVTPIHPFLLQTASADVRGSMAATLAVLKEFCGPDVKVLDHTDIASFGGTSAAFVDPSHVVGPNSQAWGAAILRGDGDQC